MAATFYKMEVVAAECSENCKCKLVKNVCRTDPFAHKLSSRAVACFFFSLIFETPEWLCVLENNTGASIKKVASGR